MVSKKTKAKRSKILTKCSDIAKDLLSISHVEHAEKVLALALSLHHDDEAQVLLDQIRNEKIKVKPNQLSQIQFDKDDLERQKQLEIKAKKQLENAPYAEMNTNRFKMRANVLSLEVSVILKKHENDIANGANTTVSLKIENLLKKTHNAINLTNLGEAEKHLLEAEKIYNDAYAKIPKLKSKNNDTTPVIKELVIPKHTPGAREKAELKGNEGDENRCIRIAQTAMKDEDYAKAEKFLLKAERLRSTIVAKKLLIVVRDLASKKESAETITSKSHEPEKDLNTTGEDNQQLAVTLTKLAKSRINDKNYEGAKTVLERAEQLFPTTAAKNLLQKILEMQTKKEASGTSNSLLEKGLKLLSDAQCMENHGKLDSAEKYLLKAEKLCPENDDVGKALVRIRNAKALDPITKEPAQPMALVTIKDAKAIDPITKEPAQPIATSSEKPESLVSPPETNISEARTAMELGNFDDAEKIILDLKDNYPNEDVTEILSEIRAARASRSSTEEFNDAKGTCAQPDYKNIQSSNNYIARAQHAITTGELEKAEEYLLKARNYYPSKTATTLLNHVQEQIGENKTKQEKEMKRVEAEKHIQNAHKAFLEGNLDKAEDQLLKAKELHLQEQIEVFLRDVNAAKITVSSPKSRLRSGKAWKESSATHQEKSVANEEEEEQVDTATIKKPKEDENLNQQTGVHKDGEADRTEADRPEAHRQRPETHMEASAQNYKHKRTPSPYSMAHRVEKVSVKMGETKIDSTKAQEKFTGTTKRGVSGKKDKYLESNANNNKTNTLGTKSRNELTKIETKEQVDTATIKKPKEDGNSNQRTWGHKDGEADRTEAHRQRPETHMEASAQSYKHKRTPSPYSMAHRDEKVSVKMVDAKIDSTKAQEEFTGTTKTGVSGKKDKCLESKANDNKTNTLGTKSRNELTKIETKEQVDTATIKKPKEDGNSNQRTRGQKDGEADRTEADRQRPETHMEACAQNYKHKRTPSPYSMAHRVEAVSVKMGGTKIDSTKAQEEFTGTTKTGVSGKKDKCLESKANDNKTNTLGTKSRNELTKIETKEQVDTATIKKPKEDGNSNQRTGVHKDGEADITEADRQRPETHMEASAQSYKHKRTPSPYSMAHRVEAVSVKMVETKIDSTKAQEKFTGTSKRGVIVKKDKYSESNANDSKTNTLGTKSRNELKTIEDLKREEAESCINIAQTALSSGNLEKAKRFLDKAERIFPTEQAKWLLKDISIMKTKNNTKDNYQPSTSSALNREIQDDVSTLINMAFEYIDSKQLNEAKLFFEIANRLSPGYYTEDLLDQIKTKIKHEEEFSTPVKKGKKHNKGKDKKIEAEYFVAIGEKALSAGETVKAEATFIVASSLNQNKRVDELLGKIRQSANAKPVGNLNDFKSAEYIRMGKNAFDIENFVLAEHFLVKAEALSPSEATKILLKKVVEAKHYVYASQKPLWRKVASYISL